MRSQPDEKRSVIKYSGSALGTGWQKDEWSAVAGSGQGPWNGFLGESLFSSAMNPHSFCPTFLFQASQDEGRIVFLLLSPCFPVPSSTARSQLCSREIGDLASRDMELWKPSSAAKTCEYMRACAAYVVKYQKSHSLGHGGRLGEPWRSEAGTSVLFFCFFVFLMQHNSKDQSSTSLSTYLVLFCCFIFTVIYYFSV